MVVGSYTESSFEAQVEAHLLASGYKQASNAQYDIARAIFPAHIITFIKATQPKAWAKLEAIHNNNLESLLLNEICSVLNKRGILEVLRLGFTFYGQSIKLAYFKPGSGKNPALWELYNHNNFYITRQLQYNPSNSKSLDIVLSLNGLPVVTCELKNALTGQNMMHAKVQYRQDRDPKAPIFWFKKRALVHFAVDTDEVWMTTELKKDKTFFLPFNRGNNHGAGNPEVPGKQRTSYLWEEIWQPASFLDIIGRFIHVHPGDSKNSTTKHASKKEVVIFPRYHQLDCVRKLIDATSHNGPGTNYLVQHSAGSGKSNTIAWLAHHLSSLHDANDKKIYDTVVVLTDRTVLDEQLQDTIGQFEQTRGVVTKIESGSIKSQELADALAEGKPIIVCTIHSFGFVQDKIRELPDRRYAIIVDEAHSSQSGELSAKVKEILSDSSVEEKLTEEQIDEAMAEFDQLAMRHALMRGPLPNLSFFAFTATPKAKTLALFGHKDASGKPVPFHLYSMRQAIEEGFILDVLKGYVTYKQFFKLAKAVADDPELDTRKASAAISRYVNLHEINISQKVELIIEHFRNTVAHHLNGRAKAMVVTSSRLQAVKYKLAFDKCAIEKGYTDLRCLVAFSQEVRDDKIPDITYTEVSLNKGIKERELPDKFASHEYQVLIVADKYQTGFDEPLLCAMYVDKKLSGIQAVQTLSRLNRMAPGKETTFVLDFKNRRDDILEAFQDYYETTGIDDNIDPQRLYELQYDLTSTNIFTQSEVDNFAGVFYELKPDVDKINHGKLNGWLDPAVDRYKQLGTTDKDRAELQEAFRSKLVAYKNLYAFMAQIVPFQDIELEKLYAYGRMLLRKLPRPDGSAPLDMHDEVVLQTLTLKKVAEGSLELQKGSHGELRGPRETGTRKAAPQHEKLSTIIETINQRFGLDLPEYINDFLGGVSDALVESDDMQLAAKANSSDNFALVFDEVLMSTIAEHIEEHKDFVNLFFDNFELQEFLTSQMLKEVYERIRKAESRPLPASEQSSESVLRILPPEEVRPFVNAVPVYDLKVAAGKFSDVQIVSEVLQQDEVTSPDDFTWAALNGRTKPSPGLFVAQVVGESMNKRVPNGAWCLWRLNPVGSRHGKIVLAKHNDIHDADLGAYTVKIYESEKIHSPDGQWQHARVTLKPDSTDETYQPLVFEGLQEGELTIIAKLVEVCG